MICSARLKSRPSRWSQGLKPRLLNAAERGAEAPLFHRTAGVGWDACHLKSTARLKPRLFQATASTCVTACSLAVVVPRGEGRDTVTALQGGLHRFQKQRTAYTEVSAPGLRIWKPGRLRLFLLADRVRITSDGRRRRRFLHSMLPAPFPWVRKQCSGLSSYSRRLCLSSGKHNMLYP
jgi:hypothetical protein